MKVYNEKPSLRAATIQCEWLGKSVSDTISGKEKVTPKAKVTWSKALPFFTGLFDNLLYNY